MKQTIQTLKNWFRRGMYPTEQQFADAFDSYRHKDDTVSLADLDTDVLDALNAKADNVALQAETQAREQALATKANAVHEHEVADVAELQETLDRKVEVAADKTLTTTVDAPTHEGKSGSYQTIVEEPITVRGKLTSKTYGNTSSVKVIYVNGGETLNIDAPRGHLLAVTLTGCTDDNTREQPLNVEVSADGETWETYAAMPETEPFANRKAEPTTVTLEFDEPVSHLRFAKPSSSYISLGFLSVTHVREVRATNFAALTDDGNVTDSGIAPEDIEEMRQDIDGKADVTHTHAIADVNGLQATLDEHTTDIQDLCDHKADIAAVNAEARAREQALALKADVTHTHPDLAPMTHTHAIADVNGLQIGLNAIEERIKKPDFTAYQISSAGTDPIEIQLGFTTRILFKVDTGSTATVARSITMLALPDPYGGSIEGKFVLWCNNSSTGGIEYSIKLSPSSNPVTVRLANGEMGVFRFVSVRDNSDNVIYYVDQPVILTRV